MAKSTQHNINNKIMYKADELYQYDKAYFLWMFKSMNNY